MKIALSDAVAAALSGRGGLSKAIQHAANGKTFMQYDSFTVSWADGKIRCTFLWRGQLVWEWVEDVTGPIDTFTVNGVEGRVELQVS